MKSSEYAFRILKIYLHDIEGEINKFKSKVLSDCFNWEDSKESYDWQSNRNHTFHNMKVERILRKILDTHYCIGVNNEKNPEMGFSLSRFTLQKTDEKFDYLYHKTNIPPEIILKEGLKVRYSFRSVKPHGPLLFLARDPGYWFGEYTYRIRIKQPIYFDTNLNWKRREGYTAFCVRNSIKPILLELV